MTEEAQPEIGVDAPAAVVGDVPLVLATPLPRAVDASVAIAVDQWFGDSFRGTRLGNDTELWNLVFQAKEDLKQRLAAIL